LLKNVGEGDKNVRKKKSFPFTLGTDGYQSKVMVKIVNGRSVRYCILCDTIEDVVTIATLVDPEKKVKTRYYLCRTCSRELESLTKENRESLVAKVIEPRLEGTPKVLVNSEENWKRLWPRDRRELSE
jgi:uncharacterized protein YlaI